MDMFGDQVRTLLGAPGVSDGNKRAAMDTMAFANQTGAAPQDPQAQMQYAQQLAGFLRDRGHSVNIQQGP